MTFILDYKYSSEGCVNCEPKANNYHRAKVLSV